MKQTGMLPEVMKAWHEERVDWEMEQQTWAKGSAGWWAGGGGEQPPGVFSPRPQNPFPLWLLNGVWCKPGDIEKPGHPQNSFALGNRAIQTMKNVLSLLNSHTEPWLILVQFFGRLIPKVPFWVSWYCFFHTCPFRYWNYFHQHSRKMKPPRR